MDLEKKWNAIYSGKIKANNFFQLKESQVLEVLNFFPDAKTALDIGCGRGELLSQLENKGIVVTGVDVSSVAIEKARKKSNATLYCANFEIFTFPKKIKFDLIFVKFVLAYIKNKKDFMIRIVDLLSDKGGLVILSPVMSKQKNGREIEEIFVEQELLEKILSQYFVLKKEFILHKDGDKKLSFYITEKQR